MDVVVLGVGVCEFVLLLGNCKIVVCYLYCVGGVVYGIVIDCFGIELGGCFKFV